MEKETKDKIKVGAGVGAGTAVLGFIQGASVDHVLVERIITSMKTGDIKGAIAFIAIFLLIWLKLKSLIAEVKEVRLALTSPDAPIAKTFAKGEKRMDDIEAKHAHDQKATEGILEDHGDRIEVLENFFKQSQGGNNGQEHLHTQAGSRQ